MFSIVHVQSICFTCRYEDEGSRIINDKNERNLEPSYPISSRGNQVPQSHSGDSYGSPFIFQQHDSERFGGRGWRHRGTEAF